MPFDPRVIPTIPAKKSFRARIEDELDKAKKNQAKFESILKLLDEKPELESLIRILEE